MHSGICECGLLGAPVIRVESRVLGPLSPHLPEKLGPFYPSALQAGRVLYCFRREARWAAAPDFVGHISQKPLDRFSPFNAL